MSIRFTDGAAASRPQGGAGFSAISCERLIELLLRFIYLSSGIGIDFEKPVFHRPS